MNIDELLRVVTRAEIPVAAKLFVSWREDVSFCTRVESHVAPFVAIFVLYFEQVTFLYLRRALDGNIWIHLFLRSDCRFDESTYENSTLNTFL